VESPSTADEKDKLMPEALDAWQKAEIAKWWPMIKAANV
jgi:hypothetical protein